MIVKLEINKIFTKKENGFSGKKGKIRSVFNICSLNKNIFLIFFK